MKKRTRYLWLALFALVVGGAYLVWLDVSRWEFAQACLDRIQLDRPLEEAEVTLKEYGFTRIEDTFGHLARWRYKDTGMYINVLIDSGIVCGKRIQEPRSNENFTSRIWRMLTRG